MWIVDTEAQLHDAIMTARQQRQALAVLGHGSKSGLGRLVSGVQPLHVAGMAGIVDYQPGELIVTVRPGTPVAELEAVLAAQNQQLAFEPADWGPIWNHQPHHGTVGGMVAAGISGPRRLKAGAVRDHILGARGVSGLGIAFSCGAKVVKNVTGFDLPKLLCGSMGTLAVLSEVTLRVAPRPASQRTLIYHDLDGHAALSLMRDAAASTTEISAAAHRPGTNPATLIRIEGSAASVAERARALKAELDSHAAMTQVVDDVSQEVWQEIRDVRDFCGNERPLWRLYLPPSRAALMVAEIERNLPCQALFDRAGSLVWLQSESDDTGEARLRDAVSRIQGQATLMRAAPGLRTAPFHPEADAVGKISEMIKLAYDPLGILEPGRMVRGR